MKKHVLYCLALGLFVLFACQKEKSFEQGDAPGVGTLQSDASGDCLPKTVSGPYVAGTPLVPTISTITVSVIVTQTGTYVISTDTVNGYHFSATGTFTTLGATNVVLRSSGTPFAAGVNNFVVSYGASICDVQVTVLPSGPAAVGTLDGGPAPGACTPVTVNGVYTAGTALAATNTVQVRVDVTTAGTYSITATSPTAGFGFAKTGTLAVGNDQLITLDATGGPPTGTGVQTFTVTFGTSTCTFPVTVASPAGAAVGTLDGGPAPGACTPVTVNGTYTVGTAITAANTVQVRIDVTTAGTYTITATSPTAGFGFSKTGTVPVGNDQLITLDATGGPPTTAGIQTFTVTFGSSTCTFPVTVSGATGAVGTLDGGPSPGLCTPVTVNGTYTVGTALTAANTVQVRIDVTTAGAYTITATSPTAGFGFSKTGTAAVGNDQLITLDFTGGPPTTPGVQTFTVTFGTSTCTFTINVQAAPLSNDYFPRTTGSNWSYEFDNDPVIDSIYRTVIAATHTAAGNTWNIFMANDGTGLDSSGYYRRNGGDYYEWFDYGTWLTLDGPGWGEYIMLKDNVPAGTAWTAGTFTGAISGTPVWIQFRFRLTQKDVPISLVTSLGTINYTNVNVVEEKIWGSLDGVNYQDLTVDLDYYGVSYYGRGVGLIKFEARDAGGGVTYLQELRRHIVL